MFYIIDGYNLMHTLEPGLVTAGNLEEKRRQLVEYVINFMGSTGDEAVIVFDSSVSEAPSRHQISNTPVTVCFASAAESADIIIGKLVQQKLKEGGKPAEKQAGRIRVVSADWEVQKGALQERVERVPPRNFIAEMKNFEKGVANSSEMDRMRWKLEHKVDVETLRKLEDMRRGND